MVRQKKKYQRGAATAYITRKQALRKLQLTLPDFRRLCILKGIYPHEPKNKRTAGKGSSNPKTYYYMKDIQFLLHEPVVLKFRAFKVFVKKLKKAIGRREKGREERLRQNKPKYKLDHIVKERYPSFIDALRDLDDCLCLVFLFATLPKSRNTPTEKIQLCRRLSVEFMHYIISSKSLRKVFISIKGIYYQVEIHGQSITWVVPHKLGFEMPTEVDFRIMSTFVEIYTTVLGFINYRLYHDIGLTYPPMLQIETNSKDEEDLCGSDSQEEKLAALTQTLKMVVDKSQEEVIQPDEFPVSDNPDHVEKARIEQEKLTKLCKLYEGCKFFINREAPRESLTFIIRALGGEVSWHKTVALGATYEESDETITHQIVDRPKFDKQYLSRYYIQPQWVFDCVNARQQIPVKDYFPGVDLPPHLSPFIEETEEDYKPPERQQAEQADSGVEEEEEEDQEAEEQIDDEDDSEEEEEDDDEEEVEDEEEEEEDDNSEDEDEDDDENESDGSPKKKKKSEEKPKDKRKESMTVSAGKLEPVDVARKMKRQENEERKLAEMMIPKKKKRLYNKIMHSKKQKAKEVRKLTEKRLAYDTEQKKLKKKKAQEIV